jgi:hypothetical protein
MKKIRERVKVTSEEWRVMGYFFYFFI